MASGYKILKSSINAKAPILTSDSDYAQSIKEQIWVDIDDIMDHWYGEQSANLGEYKINGSTSSKYAIAPDKDVWKIPADVAKLFYNSTRSESEQRFVLAGTNPRFQSIIGFSEEETSPDSSCKKFFNTPKDRATIEIQHWSSHILFIVKNSTAGINNTQYLCYYDVVPTALICLIQAAGGDGGEGKEAPNPASGSGGGAGGFLPIVLDFNQLSKQSSQDNLNAARFKFLIQAEELSDSNKSKDFQYLNDTITIQTSANAGTTWTTIGTVSCGQNGGKVDQGGKCGTAILNQNAKSLGVYSLTYSPTGGNGGKRGSAGEDASTATLYNTLEGYLTNDLKNNYDSKYSLVNYNGGLAGAGGGGGGSHFGAGGAGGSSQGSGKKATLGAGGGGDGFNDFGNGYGGCPYIGFFGYTPTKIIKY